MTTNSTDIRWKQRFSNFQKAKRQLDLFLQQPAISALEEQGLIKSFEYTFELAWNTIKDFYQAQGEAGIQGSRDAIRLAFKRGLIDDGSGWMDMIQSRIQTAHTYNEETAKEVIEKIRTSYHPLFNALETRFVQLK